LIFPPEQTVGGLGGGGVEVIDVLAAVDLGGEQLAALRLVEPQAQLQLAPHFLQIAAHHHVCADAPAGPAF